MTEITRSRGAIPEPKEPRHLLRGVDYVLFDFDGPLCRLFADYPAAAVATRLRGLVRRMGHAPLLTDLDRGQGPHGILSHLAAKGSAPPVVLSAVETAITEAEVEAVRSATPTPYARELVSALVARGSRLAVTSNNSPIAIAGYLRLHGLDTDFRGHVYGRSPADARLMKPHPDCVNRAIRGLGAEPDRCLMLGDSHADARAARAAGVSFVGYARNERKAAALRTAGAFGQVRSLTSVLASVTGPGLARRG